MKVIAAAVGRKLLIAVVCVLDFAFGLEAMVRDEWDIRKDLRSRSS